MSHVTDIWTESHGGSLFSVRPVSLKGQQWLADSLTAEDFWAAGRLMVEHRYIVDLITGMVADGLIVRDQHTKRLAVPR